MKATQAFFLTGVLLLWLSSCTVTNRKYMPGYSVNWVYNKKASVTNDMPLAKTPVAENSMPNVMTAKVQPEKQLSIVAVNKIPEQVQVMNKNKVVSALPKVSFTVANDLPTDSVKHKAKNLPEQINATRSLTFGVLNLAVPFASVILVSILFPNIGFGVLVLYLFLILACILFSIFGIVNGIKAINAIQKEPNKYSGMGDAITGLSLSSILIAAGLILLMIGLIIA